MDEAMRVSSRARYCKLNTQVQPCLRNHAKRLGAAARQHTHVTNGERMHFQPRGHTPQNTELRILQLSIGRAGQETHDAYLRAVSCLYPEQRKQAQGSRTTFKVTCRQTCGTYNNFEYSHTILCFLRHGSLLEGATRYTTSAQENKSRSEPLEERNALVCFARCPTLRRLPANSRGRSKQQSCDSCPNKK